MSGASRIQVNLWRVIGLLVASIAVVNCSQAAQSHHNPSHTTPVVTPTTNCAQLAPNASTAVIGGVCVNYHNDPGPSK